LIPVLFICYVAAYLDRVNVGFADLQRLNSNEGIGGKLLATFQGHTRRVTSAVFSPDGRRVLTASDDDTARLWEAPLEPRPVASVNVRPPLIATSSDEEEVPLIPEVAVQRSAHLTPPGAVAIPSPSISDQRWSTKETLAQDL
jgi:WD40 repeat protein